MDDSEPSGWWHRHGTTVFVLFVAALTAFLIRTIYSYSLISQCNISYCFAGGSDSFYHARVMTWIIQNHNNLVKDPMLNYPLSLINPREPLFDWMNALLGMLFAPLFGGDAVKAGMWFLEMQPPFWAAAGVVPIYLIGKEVSSRRMGLVAAIIYPLFVGSIESTVATYANYLSFYAFFVFLTLAFYIHAVKLSGTRRWVENYRVPRALWNGAKDFARVERNSLNWAVLSGVSMGATMLAWQGYTYIIAAVVIFLAITLLVERIRRMDTFGAYMVTLIMGTIAFFMAMPYYYIQGEFGYWFTVPMMVFYGAMLAMLPFLMLRDTPWLFSLGVMLASVGGAVYGLYLYNKNDFNAVITGQGYFIKTLIYSTVAEAQAPSFDSLIVSYGPVTFFLAFVGLGAFGFYLYKFKFRREHIFMVILGILGIYLPLSAAKFFLIGTPLFALLSAELILFALDRMGYSEMRHTYRTLSQSGGGFFAFRKAVKVRHLLIVVIALIVIVPNVWYAVDASIPYNQKSQYNEQIYNTLPAALRTTQGQASSFYLGAAGIQTDTPTQYDEAGYNWLSTQDTNLPPQERPAFISWWDYGFQAIDQGQHPSVADNFQDGIVPSGHFLLAQNESLAIAVLATDLLVAEETQSNQPYLPAKLNAELKAAGLNLTTLHNYLVNTTADETIVINNPGVYGPVNSGNIQGPGGALNAVYFTVAQDIASSLNENNVVKVYQLLQAYTGYSIGYGMADSRLFPTSGSNTGIYYAPVDLTDGLISPGGIPSYYFTVNATGSDGNTYPLGQVPPGVQVVSTNINYNSPFYKSMIYKIFIGYNGTQAGAGSGIPGVSSSLQSYPVMPGWMMQHFVMAYRTAYYCPYKNYSANPGCFGAVSYSDAISKQKSKAGTVDASSQSYVSGGETFLEYYPGATITGYVAFPNGQPLAGVHVTVMDQWGFPHMVSTTNKFGSYTLVAPPGNDSLIVSYGPVGGLEQSGTTILTQNVTVSQGLGMTYGGPQIFVPIKIRPATLSGRAYWSVGAPAGYEAGKDTLISGATMTLTNNATFTQNVTTDVEGAYLFPNVPPGSYSLGISLAPHSFFPLGTVNLTSGESKALDEGIKASRIGGTVLSLSGFPVSNASVTLTAQPGGTQSVLTSAKGLYNFTMLDPGNYTVRASSSGGLSSNPVSVSLFAKSQNVSVNFTLSSPVAVSLTLTYNGLPVPNVPVRFSPLEGAGNSSLVYYSGSSGVVTALLSPGIWSVYALGALNGTWVTTLFDLELGNGTLSYTGAYALSDAHALKGTIYAQDSGKPQTGVILEVISSSGAVMEASTNSSGAYYLLLPAGSYTVLATYALSGTTPTVAAVGTASLNGLTTLDLSLLPALQLRATVGYTAYTGSYVGLAGSTVTVAFNGNHVSTESGLNGALNLTLPQVNTTFTVTASHYGFAQPSALVFDSASALAKLRQITLDPVPISVKLDLSCVVPLGGVTTCPTSPVVNFTAMAPPAISTSLTSKFVNGTWQATVELSPGTYAVTISASASGELWTSVGTVSATVPVGSPPLTLAPMTLLKEGTYYGNISLPIGVNPSILPNATVQLSNPILGLINLTATEFTNQSSPFHAPPGNYTVWVVDKNGTKAYSFIGNISLVNNGGRLSPIKLVPADTFVIAFKNSYGQTQNPPIGVTVTSVSGPSYGARLSFSSGASATLSVILPNGTYAIHVNTTTLINVTGIEHYVTFFNKPSPSYCSLNFTLTTCTVVLSTTSASTKLTGMTYIGDSRLMSSGTLRLVPVGGNASSEVTAPISGGYFSLYLLPGAYTVYATTDDNGAPAANVTQLSIPYSGSGVNETLHMDTGWYTTLTLAIPSGVTPSMAGQLNITALNTSENFYLSGLPFGTPFSVILPTGHWGIKAYSFTYPYGKKVVLQSQQNLTLENANAALYVPLQAIWVKTATMAITGPTSSSGMDNGNVSFSFTVNNTGNSPELIHFKGAPVTWNFTFFPSNATLYPTEGRGAVSVDVRVHIPNGTLVTQGQATFEALLNGSTVPVASASVTVNIAPIHAITIRSTPSKDVVGNHSISIGFTMSASGNSVENATLSLLNGGYLEQLGWTYVITGNFATLTPLNPATVGTLTLTAKIAGAVLPSNVTLYAVDNAAPGLTSTLTIALPTPTLTVPGPLIVTGSNIGSPAPAYMSYLPIVLTVAPAIAIVSYALARRWWKTRRWVRR